MEFAVCEECTLENSSQCHWYSCILTSETYYVYNEIWMKFCFWGGRKQCRILKAEENMSAQGNRIQKTFGIKPHGSCGCILIIVFWTSVSTEFKALILTWSFTPKHIDSLQRILASNFSDTEDRRIELQSAYFFKNYRFPKKCNDRCITRQFLFLPKDLLPCWELFSKK